MTHTLDKEAREILRMNDRGGYTIPTSGLYPYQWNWDSMFSAWGLSTFDIDRAWVEVQTLFSGQWADGMVPHIIFHKDDPGYFPGPDVWQTSSVPPSSGISQPPVAATMVRLIWERDKAAGKERMRALYPKLLAWHRWWAEMRCAHGPAAITHPWESGRDNCPDWDIGMAAVDGSGVGEYTRRDTGHVDPSMRPLKEEYDKYIAIVQFGRSCGWNQTEIVANGPFLMADPGITFILLRAHKDLIAIGEVLGEETGEIAGWAEALENSLTEIWNPSLEAYDARDLKTGAWANNLSSAAFLYLLAGLENPRMDAHLARVWDKVNYGLPSADPEGGHFDPRRYWRGPTWPVFNALIGLGFDDLGREEDSKRLRGETVALIEKGGFYEYFDPLDATACGGGNFSWTAAIWLTWASPET